MNGTNQISRQLQVTSRSWPRPRCCQQTRNVASVSQIQQSVRSVTRDDFRQLAFDHGRPLVMKEDAAPETMGKWFKTGSSSPGRYTATGYLSGFGKASFVQFEMLRDSPEVAHAFRAFQSWLERQDTELAAYVPQSDEPLMHIHAPLELFLKALEFNSSNAKDRVTQLYVAQVPLNELPHKLQEDLPPPDIVKSAGKGDIYNSSIWLGLEPTYTSWHRDPNPNLFSQLHSSKLVRLLPPNAGAAVFRDVQSQLGRLGSSHIRGYEMMYGEERDALRKAIWSESAPAEIQEAKLDAGDSLFIPKGWWHSIKSASDDGRLNCSVNWWFR